MKNENAKKVVIAILILLLLVVGIILLVNLTGNTDKNESSAGIKEMFNDNNKIENVNENSTSQDKLAVVFDANDFERGLIMTIDKIGIASGYDEKFENDVAEIKKYNESATEMKMELENNYSGEVDYSINIEWVPTALNDEVIKTDGNWSVVKSQDVAGSVILKTYYYFIYTLNNYNEYGDKPIRVARVETDDEQKVINRFNECIKMINFYYVDETANGYLSALDMNNNKVNLEEYVFLKDIFAKYLVEKALILDSSNYIKEYDSYGIHITIPKESEEDSSNKYIISKDTYNVSEPEDTFNFKDYNIKGEKTKLLLEKDGKKLTVYIKTSGIQDFEKIKRDFIRDFE